MRGWKGNFSLHFGGFYPPTAHLLLNKADLKMIFSGFTGVKMENKLIRPGDKWPCGSFSSVLLFPSPLKLGIEIIGKSSIIIEVQAVVCSLQWGDCDLDCLWKCGIELRDGEGKGIIIKIFHVFSGLWGEGRGWNGKVHKAGMWPWIGSTKTPPQFSNSFGYSFPLNVYFPALQDCPIKNRTKRSLEGHTSTKNIIPKIIIFS